MSEIDKLINQAFPDELRDIEPIDVDEDAILAMTLEQLGLEQGPELPVPVAKPLRRLAQSEPVKEKPSGPEFVEVPVVLHHRWVDWAGWAIAAYLVLVCAVNWGPWLVNNLDFGIGPRSPGTSAQSSGTEVQDHASEAASGGRVKGGTVSVYISSVEYNEDEMTITLFVNDVGANTAPDLDRMIVKLTAGSEEMNYLNRSNTDKQISVTYKLGSVNTMELTVQQLVELTDDNGNMMGLDYQDVDAFSMNLAYGYATSKFDNGHFEFTRRP